MTTLDFHPTRYWITWHIPPRWASWQPNLRGRRLSNTMTITGLCSINMASGGEVIPLTCQPSTWSCEVKPRRQRRSPSKQCADSITPEYVRINPADLNMFAVIVGPITQSLLTTCQQKRYKQSPGCILNRGQSCCVGRGVKKMILTDTIY